MNREVREVFTNVYKEVMDTPYFFYIFIGGRGLGKTYSMLKGSFFDHKKILYIRRTDKIIDKSCSEATNPYKAINLNEGTNVQVESGSGLKYLVDKDNEDDAIVGYGAALSTFGNLRGVDFSDVELIFFDEFINILPVNTLKNEANLLFDLIETVNRNRELLGKPSIKVVLCSNANTINDDIIRTLGLADKIQIMKEEDEHYYIDKERGLYLQLLENKEVHDLKLQTSLYKLTKGTSFYEMALENEFTRDYFGDIDKVDYKEFKPLCHFNNLYFYEHKSKDLLFITYRKTDCIGFNDHTLKAFKRSYGFKILWYIETGLALYYDYNVKLIVKDLFK